MDLEKRLSITDEHVSQPLVRETIYGRYSFRRDVEKFYGVQLLGPSYQMIKTPKKSGSPACLDVLESLNETHFNREYLEFEDVRNTIRKFQSNVNQSFVFGGLGFILSMTGIVGIIGGLSLLPSASFILPGAASIGYAARPLRRPLDMSPISEYRKLIDTATGTDRFLQGKYKNYLIEKAISASSPAPR